MELIGVKENSIKINRTIFNMSAPVERTTKIGRNVDSGTTQLQQMETLLRTLLRLEAIRANAYERWQPFFNEAQMNFTGLVAYLNVFHNDCKTIENLERYFQSRRMALSKLKANRSNPACMTRLRECKTYGSELMEDLREKIYSLQLTSEDFKINLI